MASNRLHRQESCRAHERYSQDVDTAAYAVFEAARAAANQQGSTLPLQRELAAHAAEMAEMEAAVEVQMEMAALAQRAEAELGAAEMVSLATQRAVELVNQATGSSPTGMEDPNVEDLFDETDCETELPDEAAEQEQVLDSAARVIQEAARQARSIPAQISANSNHAPEHLDCDENDGAGPEAGDVTEEQAKLHDRLMAMNILPPDTIEPLVASLAKSGISDLDAVVEMITGPDFQLSDWVRGDTASDDATQADVLLPDLLKKLGCNDVTEFHRLILNAKPPDLWQEAEEVAVPSEDQLKWAIALENTSVTQLVGDWHTAPRAVLHRYIISFC